LPSKAIEALEDSTVFYKNTRRIKGEQTMKAGRTVSTLIAAAALIALSVPVTAFSEMKESPGKEHRGGHVEKMERGHMDMMGDSLDMCVEHADIIGLSDAQITKMKPLHREMQKKHVRYIADLKIAELDLMGIMEVKDFDIEKATDAVKKIADIKTSHHLEMLKAMKEVRASWTEEQFGKMKKLMPMKPGEKKMHKKIIKTQP
jgi:Spy/CpxP family protein refolding chaperone